jgi:hypothetical protein
LTIEMFFMISVEFIIVESKMEHVAAILSDFDGTLCSTSSIKYDSCSNFIPRPVEDILCEISLSIPICIITSKDFDFIYPKTKKFAKILSCILGLETFVLKDRKQINHNINIPNENNNRSYLDDVIIQEQISSFDSETLSINSCILSEIVTYLKKEYEEINVEKKFLKSKQNLIGGITIDLRHYSNWTANKEKYREIVKESVSIVLESASEKR